MAPRASIDRTRSPARSAVILVLAVLAVLAVGPGGRAGPQFPLDDYPGFGRSSEAALRDDTIAYWEAYRRELIVRECMAVAGFPYELTVAYPHAEIVLIADGLGVGGARAEADELSPTERNRAYESGLSTADRDRYFQALFDEAAVDVDEADRTGRVPPGRGEDFATGGCFGEAQDAIPGIWRARHELEDAFEDMRRDIASSPEMALVVGQYADCTGDVGGERLEGPWAVDEALARMDQEGAPGSARAELDRVATACAAAWEAGYRGMEIEAAHRFVARNRALLEEVADRYAGVIDEIARDADFLDHLGAHAALAREVPDAGALAPSGLDKGWSGQ